MRRYVQRPKLGSCREADAIPILPYHNASILSERGEMLLLSRGVVGVRSELKLNRSERAIPPQSSDVKYSSAGKNISEFVIAPYRKSSHGHAF